MEIKAKIVRWQKKNKVNGTLMGAKNMPPAPGYKAQQWGTGPSGNASGSKRMRNFNRKP